MKIVRRGFSLIELIVALTLSGIVALLAYGSIQAGLENVGRLDNYRRNSESVTLMRSLLESALRHPSDPPAGGGSAFEISSNSRGTILGFVSRGITGPPGAGELWRVAIQPSPHGLEFSARSLENGMAPIVGSAPALKSFSVRVLRFTDDVAWQDHWESTGQFPAAVEISFRDSTGAVTGPPLLVSTALGVR